MKIDRAELAATLAPGLALALLMGLSLLGWRATLEPVEEAAFDSMLAPRGGLLLLGWLLASGALGALCRSAWHRYAIEPARLAEQARILVETDAHPDLPTQGAAHTLALAQALAQLARQRDGLRADMQIKVQEASREVEQERTRLAALMAELTQSVVVCNLDGRILLYNNRARVQFRALSDAPRLADGAELIGLGRSIYAVFDRALVAHALESIRQRLERGAAHPSAQFVTSTQAGQLLRVQMAPVRAIAPPLAAPGAGTPDSSVEPLPPSAAAGVTLNGFVLMLDNITRDFADESQRDRLLHGLTESSRASLGTLQAALEMLEFPDLDAPTRERFHAVIRDEVQLMSTRIREVAGHATQAMKTRWPLQEMQGADLLAAAQRRIEAQCGCRSSADPVDPALWLKVDSFSLLQALLYLASRLVGEYEVGLVRLRLASVGGRAQLDLVWQGLALSTETVIGWETDPMGVDGGPLALTVRDVVERHDGAFWFERERVRHEALFRFLLPLAAPSDPLDASQVVHSDSRPEFYDFDLFRTSEQSRDLDERALSDLVFTVFDTETTGLDPSAGDEIIQIGATRIVGGKLRRTECFEQLVDPQRTIPEASIPIHGIRPEMVAGQPTLDVVLPAFHRFAEDTVLVAHNAAFDMRFLQLKEASTGVHFAQPVLDTLLLSAVVHPNQASHGLEAIAERLGVTVLGRHTALGDAMVTAEVFLKLLPLLAQQGISTLGQAREAAQKTYYARLTY